MRVRVSGFSMKSSGGDGQHVAMVRVRPCRGKKTQCSIQLKSEIGAHCGGYGGGGSSEDRDVVDGRGNWAS